MRKYIYLSLILFHLILEVNGQDIPLYSQKLTNSFIYNPSAAGNGLGSVTLSHRKFWSGLDNASSSNMLSFHMPFAYHKFGTGATLFSENVGIYDRIYTSAAFAYHINISDDNSFSMGFSSEYNNLKINTSRLDVIDQNDVLLFGNNLSYNSLDFSFGLSYRSKYLDIGVAANRLSTTFGIVDDSNQLSEFFSGFLMGKIPLASDRDLLEPILTFRQLSTESNQYDLGLYYTFNDLFILGGSFRSDIGGSSPQATITTALRLKDRLMIGYSYETLNGGLRSDLGNSSEITLRLDFRDDKYVKKTKNSKQVMNNALAFRRKTLTKSSSSARSKAKVNAQKLKKRLKRNYLKSPNYRMNSSKKLHVKKVKHAQVKRKKTKKRYSSHYKRRRRN